MNSPPAAVAVLICGSHVDVGVRWRRGEQERDKRFKE